MVRRWRLIGHFHILYNPPPPARCVLQGGAASPSRPPSPMRAGGLGKDASLFGGVQLNSGLTDSEDEEAAEEEEAHPRGGGGVRR
jgi:hypothetical protein